MPAIRPFALMLLALIPLAGTPSWGMGYADDPFTPTEPTLMRRGTIGVQPGWGQAPVPGVLLAGVMPDGAADRAGIRAGDVLVSIGGVETPDGEALSRALQGLGEGQDVGVTIHRDGARIEKRVTLGERRLALPGTEVRYGEVMTPDGYAVRTILMLPEGRDAAAPGVFFIQGIPCSSIDAMSVADRGLLKCIQDVALAGYAVLLVDKPGVGDSGGPPCAELGFDEETRAFGAALRAFKSHPAVDADRVFIVGISMGGIQAPILAAEEPVAGVAVFGTGFVPWTEYMISNVRRQAALTGAGPAQINMIADFYAKFWSLLLYARQHPSEILAAHPELAQVGFTPTDQVSAGRSVRFFTEMHDSNWSASWSLVDTNVLAMHGTFDFVCARQDHEWIVEVVNTLSPGAAEFVALDRMCHGMTVWESEQQALRTGLGAGEPSDAATAALLRFFERAQEE